MLAFVEHILEVTVNLAGSDSYQFVRRAVFSAFYTYDDVSSALASRKGCSTSPLNRKRNIKSKRASVSACPFSHVFSLRLLCGASHRFEVFKRDVRRKIAPRSEDKSAERLHLLTELFAYPVHLVGAL